MSGWQVDPRDEPPTVVGLLDQLIDQGVHVAGDVSIGLADVDLIRVALRLLVASEDTARRTGRSAGPGPSREPASPWTTNGPGATDVAAEPPSTEPPSSASGVEPPRSGSRLATPPPPRRAGDVHQRDRENLLRGIGQLVLTIVEVIHDLLDRQAARRVESGSLDPEQVERLGVALAALKERMEEVKDVFGVTDEDLDLDLGPLGRLR